MKAFIIAVGSELAAGRVADTNKDWLAGKLMERGTGTEATMIAPDSQKAIGHLLECALRRSPDLIVVTGGLGPTHDDLTAAAISRQLDIPLKRDSRAAAMIAAVVGATPETLKPHQEKQAMLPEGSIALKPSGTAPGFVLEIAGTVLVALPGVPWEMKQMWSEAEAAPPLARLFSRPAEFKRRSVFLYGAGEPEADRVILDFLGKIPGDRPDVTICASFGQLLVDIDYRPEHESDAAGLAERLRAAFPEQVFSAGEPIEAVTGRELSARGMTLATAESCTAGMLGETITSVSGASEYYLGGVVAYHNDVKMRLLGVGGDVLAAEGAVSEPVAGRMSAGVREALGADLGIGITGIAGPGGGTPDKPVGLVYLSVASGTGVAVRRFRFPGGREDVRRAAVVNSLHMLHKIVMAERSSP